MEPPFDNSDRKIPKEGDGFVYRSDSFVGHIEIRIDVKRYGEIDFDLGLYRRLPNWLKVPRLKKPKKRSTLFPLK